MISSRRSAQKMHRSFYLEDEAGPTGLIVPRALAMSTDFLKCAELARFGEKAALGSSGRAHMPFIPRLSPRAYSKL